MKSFFIHHMRKIYNAICRWRYFFACREEWSPPLPLGAPRPMSYWSLGLYYLYSFVLLISLTLWLRFSISNMLDIYFSLLFHLFLCPETGCDLRDSGFSIAIDFCFPKGHLYKCRSSLGRFLYAPLHFTKNTLLSQGVTPL